MMPGSSETMHGDRTSPRWAARRWAARAFLLVVAAAAGTLLRADSAHAQDDFFFRGGTRTWSTGTNWWTTYLGTTTPASGPNGVNDTAVFNISGGTSAGTAVFTDNATVRGLVVLPAANAALTLRGDGVSNRTLTLGAGGIVSQPVSASALTLGSTTVNQGLNVSIGASQEWRLGNRILTINNQIVGTAGSGTSQTLLIVTSATNNTTIGASGAGVVFSDNPGGGALNLWFNANGGIFLPASNALSGTLTLQNSLARQAGGLSATTLPNLTRLQLAGGSVSGTVTLNGTSSSVSVLGGATAVKDSYGVLSVGTLERPVGGGLFGGVGSAVLRGVTNGPGMMVNGLLPWGGFGSQGTFARIVSGSYVQAAALSAVPSGNLNNITGTTGNWERLLNGTAFDQTLTTNIAPSALMLSNTSTNASFTINTGAFTLESNAIYFRTATEQGIATISGDAGGGLKIGSSGELVMSAKTAQVTLAAPVSGAGWLTLGMQNLTNLGDGWFALRLNNAYALGSGTFRIGGNAIVLDNTSAGPITIATENLHEWNSDFSFGGTQPLDLGTGTVSLGTWAGSRRTITTDGTAALTVGGRIMDGTYGDLPTKSLVKSGSGTLVLGGANTYTGGTEFSP